MVHIPASILFFAYAFKTFPAPAFQAVRRTLVCCNLIAFIVFSSWPCMPPRLLPAEYGYEDTLHKGKAASIWTTNKVGALHPGRIMMCLEWLGSLAAEGWPRALRCAPSSDTTPARVRTEDNAQRGTQLSSQLKDLKDRKNWDQKLKR